MGRKRKSTEFYDVSATSVHTSHVGDVLMQDAMIPEDDNCFGANTRRQQQVNGTSTTGSGSSANARERARMRVLSRAFVRLKTTLPWVPVDTKLSKLDTLRLATCYIAHLRHVLADDVDSATDNDVTTVTANTSDDSKTSSSPPATFPVNLTWPYSFGPRQANDCRTNHRTGKFAVTSSSPPAANSDFALS